MLNSIYYTFSTIAQTLAGAIALLGAFVLFRLQSLNAEIDKEAYSISVPLDISLASGEAAAILYRDRKYRDLLEMAAQNPIRPGIHQALRERQRLPILLDRQDLLIRLFKWAFYVTLGLIVFSVLALTVANTIAASFWTAVAVFIIGIFWLLACVRSYILLMLESLK